MYPTSGLGKTIAGLAMFLGILLIAFPITILSINMSELYDESKKQKRVKEFTTHVAVNNPLDKLRFRVSVTNIPDITQKQLSILKSVISELDEIDSFTASINNMIYSLQQEQEQIRAGVQILLGRGETYRNSAKISYDIARDIKVEPFLAK
eukprot:NODE_249_length_12946_cov_0.357438.p11 type:complete len:151 gc:universal NODE_249_length_12946_cov_0.357438:9727-9275(-)